MSQGRNCLEALRRIRQNNNQSTTGSTLFTMVTYSIYNVWFKIYK